MPALTQEDFIKDFTSEKVSIRLNEEKNGVEVKFADIPLARRENAAIKAAGFRWSGRQQLWYAKQNENSLGYAVNLRSQILSEMEQNGEKTYSAKEFNAEIEKELELESALNPKRNYENIKTENILEVDGELEKLLKQQEELNKRIAELKQKKAQKISLDKNTFNKENVNSYNYNNLHSSESAEENYEGEKSSGNAAGKSDDNRKQDKQGNSGSPLAEHNNRDESDLGGNSGGGHGGAGHGNDIRQEFQTAEFRGNVSASSNDSSIPDGHIRQSDEGQDSDGNAGLLHSGVQTGRLADGLSELHSGDEPVGHGDGLLKQEAASKAEMREIREKCREILKKPDSEITEDEKKILALYEGGGGLKEQDATSNETLNAFYTPRNIIRAVWNLADHYAPNAKSVLEPTSGIGRFAENRPQNEFTLREADETSARIAKILHPDSNVIQGEFQAQFFDENGIFRLKNYEMPKYDLVIGNPPYGAYTGEWKGKGEGKEHNRYEEYFIEKGLDSLKDENSVLAFVVPSGWIRSGIDGIKHRIAEKGKLVDAYRLPNKAFPTTEVGTDIIVMRKWNRITEEEKKIRIKAETEKISGDTWFNAHPEKVLGETKGIINRFGKPDFEVVLPDGVSLDDEIRKIDGFVANANYENALNKVSSGFEAYASGKISKSELDELSKEHAEAAEVLGKNAEKNQIQSLNLPENTVDLTDVFDGKLKNQAEIAKYIKSISDEVFVTYDNYKIGILPKDSKHIVYTNGTPYRSQKIRMNNYLVNLEKVLKNAKLKGVSDAKDKKDVKEFYYFEVPVKVGDGLYMVQFDCKKNSDVVIAKEQSSNKLTDNNIAEINPKEIFEINQVDCFLYNLKERVVTRNLSQEKKQELNQNRSWSNIAERAEGNGWNDVEVADYNKARNQISEYAKDVFEIDLEKSEIPEEAIDEFVKNHKEISFDKDLNLVIDDSLVKPENFSSREISNICEKKYGFYFEYENHENLADVYSKDGDLVGSYHDGRFGYAGPNLKVQIPDDYAR